MSSQISRRGFLQGSALIAAGAFVAPRLSVLQSLQSAKGRVVVGTVGDLNNLDPFVMTFNNYPMMENVYDQFVRLDNQVKPQPGVITEWTPSSDGTKLTLKMRQGIKYHDGSKATIDDVVACIRRAADTTDGGNQYPNWQTLKDVTIKGNDSVEVTFSAPVAFIIPALGFISLIRPGAFSSLKNTEGGSGPFRVKEWAPGDYLDLERFADYWDSSVPLIESARVKFFADESAMVAALEQGAIDIVLSLPPRENDRLKGKFNITRGQDGANFYYLGFNPKMPPFDKKEVRQAIAYALDKQTMTKNVLFGISEPISTPYPKFSSAYSDEHEKLYPFDLDKAKALLTAAGYPNGITFSIATTGTFPEFGQFAEILKANLAKIGSTVNIEPMDIAQWVPVLLEAKFGAIFSFAGGTQWFPTRITLSNNFSTENNVVWPNGKPPAEYVAGITKADTTFDAAAQKAAMKQAVDSLMDQMWAAPIAFRYTLFAQAKTIGGFDYGTYDQPRLRNVISSK
jgi:peptide/nickel transport system substrate-binding protein